MLVNLGEVVEKLRGKERRKGGREGCAEKDQCSIVKHPEYKLCLKIL